MTAAVRYLVETLHDPSDGELVKSRDLVLHLLDQTPAPFSRDQFAPGHITCTGLVLSPDAGAFLLVHHRRLDRWLLPGGHVEACDATIADAARREVVEETGAVLAADAQPRLIGIDVHGIPPGKGEPYHLHHDLLFAFRALYPDFQLSHESRSIAWARPAEFGRYDIPRNVRRGDTLDAVNRRRFLRNSAASAFAPAAAAAQSASANDKIGVAVIGCGGMGRNDLADFHKQPDVEIRAVCDVFRPAADQARQMAGARADIYSDFRRVLDRKDVDAVVIATPDHWHALIAVMACEAGKDVYVEKPVSHNVREGRLMVEAARRYNRVAQVGIQQRSGSHFQRAVQAVHDGRLGDVHFAQCWNHNYSPDRHGMGFPAAAAPPAGLDWDLWLGPAPAVPYTPARRNFRVFWDYAGGELTNWCVHLLDVVHWALGLDAPDTVVSSGGKWYFDDCRECADTQEVVWEYPGNVLVRYSTLAHNSFGPNGHAGNKSFGSYGIMLQGTKGTLFIDRAGYEITPQMTAHSEPQSAGSREAYDDLLGFGQYFTGAGGGERGATSAQHVPHVRNFLDCMKSRKRPAGDIEIGHKSTAPCLIGNIALRTGLKLKWDGKAERFTNSSDANAMLTRQYRAPWTLAGL